MNSFTKINLKMENGNFLFLNEEYLKKYREELLEFLEDQDYMKSLSFAKRMMMSKELKMIYRLFKK